MSSESIRFDGGGREPSKIQERGYNPPPVAKVVRPDPSRPAPRPGASVPPPKKRP